MKWQSKACKISAKQLIFGFNESRKKILVPKKFAKNFADSLFIYFAFFKELYAKYIMDVHTTTYIQYDTLGRIMYKSIVSKSIF